MIYELAAAADKTINTNLGKDLIIYSFLKYAYRNAVVDGVGHSTNAASSDNAAIVNTTHDKNTIAENPVQNTPELSAANGIGSHQLYPRDQINSYHQYAPPPSDVYPISTDFASTTAIGSTVPLPAIPKSTCAAVPKYTCAAIPKYTCAAISKSNYAHTKFSKYGRSCVNTIVNWKYYCKYL